MLSVRAEISEGEGHALLTDNNYPQGLPLKGPVELKTVWWLCCLDSPCCRIAVEWQWCVKGKMDISDYVKEERINCWCTFYGLRSQWPKFNTSLTSALCFKPPLEETSAQELLVNDSMKWISMAEQWHTSLRWLRSMARVGWSDDKHTTRNLWSTGNVFAGVNETI